MRYGTIIKVNIIVNSGTTPTIKRVKKFAKILTKLNPVSVGTKKPPSVNIGIADNPETIIMKLINAV